MRATRSNSSSRIDNSSYWENAKSAYVESETIEHWRTQSRSKSTGLLLL
jgi:hypothetical protein